MLTLPTARPIARPEEPDEVRRLTPRHKAEVLIQALPWLRTFAGSVVVIKYGGHAMVSKSLRHAFAQDVLFLHQVGIRPVVVHGGGPQISEMLTQLDIQPEFVGGLRVTTPQAMDVVRMVLTGQVQRELVNLINAEDPCAVGISGEDGRLLRARQRQVRVDGHLQDIGRVGDVAEVDPTAVLDLLHSGRIPVVSTVAGDIDNPGEVLNVNADTAAAALAVSLGASKLLVLSDVEGIYRHWGEDSDPIRLLGLDEAKELLPQMTAGMQPKLEACVRAIEGGVPQAHLIDGRIEHSMLVEVFTTEDMGTMVLPEAMLEVMNGVQRDH
ncbi:N-acetylglutamate kinase [Luteococcus japonicus]|uniref:Acetylglutamate kinase n=1 Tax=Luteococcus japonicus TaxID=33984 RepID=A0A3N1ZWN2_9ACTN|nr:acetylglutamate kinase [Luteococcus japonicus]ROR54907.1 N-acetylglutamate kinase [Luteococcus japonicus]